MRYVYFPEEAVISAVSSYSNGGVIEMATVGREGCTGIEAVLGADRMLVNNMVQISGDAWRMDVEDFCSLVDASESFRSVVYRYIQAFIYQLLVSGACNGAHRLDQRLARWLLNMSDRTDGEVLFLTHEFLAEMLGVQRPSVTNEAREFQAAGIIRYERGKLQIVDRRRLEQASCECYRLVRNAYDALLPVISEEALGRQAV